MGLPGEDLVLLAAAIAISISKDLSTDDIVLLAALLDAIADNLEIIATKRELLEEAGR
ncbi:MAG: hypothetical protein GX189_02360 [Clostridiales bacterium]|nr:hypothetical protein [Clostridiales bacterium]